MIGNDPNSEWNHHMNIELVHKDIEPKIDKNLIDKIIIGTKRKHSGGSVMRQELVEELHRPIRKNFKKRRNCWSFCVRS